MQKVEGVQDVRVSLKEGLTMLDLKPGNRITVAKLRGIIKSNGFVSRDAVIVAAGAELPNAGGAVFEVSGTGERVRLAGPAAQDGQGLWRFTTPAK